jgi:tetratricopeptide (TPR) repeat protein
MARRDTRRSVRADDRLPAGLKWKGILVALIGCGVAVGLWLQSDVLFESPGADRLPVLPDLTGQPRALIDHLRTADRAARERPTVAGAVSALGMAYHADVFYDEAAQCYALGEALDPGDWRWPYYAALIQKELGASTAAADCLRRVTALNPDFTPAWFRLGEAALKLGRSDEAETAFRKAIQTGREHPPPPGGPLGFPMTAYATHGLARLALERNDPEEARLLLEALIEAIETFGPAHRLLGRAYQELGREEDAGERLARAAGYPPYPPPSDAMVDALARVSCSATYLLKQMGVAEQNQDGVWAEYLARRALKVNPDDPELLVGLGILLLRLQRPDEALSYIESYREQAPNDFHTLTTIGYGLVNSGRPGKAEAFLQEVLNKNPGATRVYNALGFALARLERFDEAIHMCQEALTIDPNDVDAHNNLAAFLGHEGRFDEAVAHYHEALRIGVNPAEAYTNLGRMFAERGKFDEAREYLEAALQIRPNYIKAHNNLGIIQAQQGAYKQARAHLEKVLRISPEYEKAYLNLGQILVQQGELDEAASCLETVLRIRPDYADAHNSLAVVLVKKGAYARAL